MSLTSRGTHQSRSTNLILLNATVEPVWRVPRAGERHIVPADGHHDGGPRAQHGDLHVTEVAD